jgi:O-antigen ligase
MMRILETLWLTFFLLGLLVLGVFGTWADTTPFWYGAGLISVAGTGAVLSRQGPAPSQIGWGPILLLLALAIYIGWRGLTSEVRYLARQDLVFAATAVVAYGLVAVRFTGRRARLAILAVLVLLIAGNTGLGLYQYFENHRLSIFSPFGLRRAEDVSASGFFESGNHFAGFLTLAGISLLGVAVLGQGLHAGVRTSAAIGFVLAAIGLAFSTSRGGAVGFSLGFLVFGLIAVIVFFKNRQSARLKGKNRAGWWLTALGFVFLTMIGGTGLMLRKTFNSGQLTSLNGRGPLWDAALEQWQLSPLTGTGARSYEYMERGFRTLDTGWGSWAGEIDAQFAHNDFLQCLADYGMIGLGLVLLVTGWHFRHALGSILEAGAKPDGLATGLAAGATAALAGIMGQALVEFNLHIGINAVMCGLLLGFLATPGFEKPAAASPKSKPGGDPEPRAKAGARICGRRLAVSAIVAALSVILLESGWRLAPADYACRLGKKQLGTALALTEMITASATFQRATTLDPDNADAWANRGMINLQIASLTNEKYCAPFYEAALTQLDRALILYPQNPYVAAHAGSVASYLGRTAQAERHFATALRWGLNIQTVNELYGDYLIRQKEYYKAVGYLGTGRRLATSVEVAKNIDIKLDICLRKLRKQGITPPPTSLPAP